MCKKILVALDHAEMSQQVWRYALALAQCQDAQLMLLHVLSMTETGYPTLTAMPDSGLYPGITDVPIAEYKQQCEAFEQAILQELNIYADQAIVAGLKAECTQTPGDPGRTICDVATTWNADMIVLGNRGRSGLSELLLGSVSNYVTHHAPCSVLVVRVPAPAEVTAP